MSLSQLLVNIRNHVKCNVTFLPPPWPVCTLFLSISDGKKRASVVNASAEDFDTAWLEIVEKGRQLAHKKKLEVCWIRVDWVDAVRRSSWGERKERFKNVKRNYFRYGLALDDEFKVAFHEQELNANAALYGGNKVGHCVLNEKNFTTYARQRFDKNEFKGDFSDSQPAHRLNTQGVFCAKDESPKLLYPTGRSSGRRIIDALDADSVQSLVKNSSDYLGIQVKDNGEFYYGWHPCFDRPIRAYNTLRHASSTYAMIEAWEITQDNTLKRAIDRSLHYLTTDLIKKVKVGGETMAFLTEANDEIKLGGNAVSLLALVKYSEVTGSYAYLSLIEMLALGIRHMQDAKTGEFVHVLEHPTLNVKEKFRIIYYEGEAAFGLMRAYGLTKDPRWLETVEKAFDHFIAKEHWKHHDHWLSYCVNELTLYRPKEKYYRFGIQNVAGYLDFVLERITTFPTLLELMMAAQRMTARLEESEEHRHLLENLDMEKFYRALHARAHYLLNGYMWPEYAMFFKNPERILGSFFIRHHAFRVRIDDVEHYLSGYVAYFNYLCRTVNSSLISRGDDLTCHGDGWNACHLEKATAGHWIKQPKNNWSASGVTYFSNAVKDNHLVVLKDPVSKIGVAPEKINTSLSISGFMVGSSLLPVVTNNSKYDDTPILKVEDVNKAILDIGCYARERMSGVVIGVTGSSGKTTGVAMLAHVLEDVGQVHASQENANLPHGIAWNLSTAGWNTPHVIIEMAVGKMYKSSRMVRPHVAVFLNVHPAHIGQSHSIKDIARVKSSIFEGMAPGGIAVINRDMEEFHQVYKAALKCKLRVVLFGKHESCDVQLIGYDWEMGVVTFSRHKGNVENIKLGAKGYHMALNALAVIAVITALGYPEEKLLQRLNSFCAIPGRGSKQGLSFMGRQVTLIDDAYNANPGSMVAALKLFGHTKVQGRRLAVLGQMEDLGPASECYHTALLEVVERVNIDKLYVVGSYYCGFWKKLTSAKKGAYASTIEEVQSLLEKEINDGDGVLVKGSNSTGVHKIVDWMKSKAG